MNVPFFLVSKGLHLDIYTQFVIIVRFPFNFKIKVHIFSIFPGFFSGKTTIREPATFFTKYLCPPPVFFGPPYIDICPPVNL